MLRIKSHAIWLKKIKTFLFFKNKLSRNVKFFNNNPLLSYGGYYNVFMLKKNESVLLKIQYSVLYKKLNFIGICSNKSKFRKKNVFGTVYAIYKIFLKNGFLLKVVKSLNKTFKQLNKNFYNSCFADYVKDNFLFVNEHTPSGRSACVELYSFKNFFYCFQDLALIDDDGGDFNGGTISFSDNFNFFNNNDCASDDKSVGAEWAADHAFNNFSGEFFLNIFFKYFFFFNISNSRKLIKKVQSGDFVNSYFLDACGKSYKSVSVSFFFKYFFFIFYNLGKRVRIEYSKLLNNFLSIFFFIPKLVSLITFFFKVQAVSLSKRVRKSLKNKYRHAIVYKYIKPSRRLKTSLSFLKSFLLLVEGQGLDKKISNMFFSIMLEKNDSLVVRLKNIQQFECFKHMRFEKS